VPAIASAGLKEKYAAQPGPARKFKCDSQCLQPTRLLPMCAFKKDVIKKSVIARSGDTVDISVHD